MGLCVSRGHVPKAHTLCQDSVGPSLTAALQRPADGYGQNFKFLLTWYQEYHFYSHVAWEQMYFKGLWETFMSGDNIPIILIIIACHCLENASFIVLPLLEMSIKQLTA